MSGDEFFDDLSLPEISPELWAELCRDQEPGTSTTHAPEVVPPTPAPVPTPTPPAQTDTDSDENLWAEFQELSLSDWMDFDLLLPPPVALVAPIASIAPVAPVSPVPLVAPVPPVPPIFPVAPAANPKPSFIPVYKIGLRPKDLDIEDYSKFAGPRKRSPNFSFSKEKRCLSVTNIVQPLWCEYKTKYDLVGFKHRPAEQRPAAIKLKKTVVVDNKEVIKEVSIRIDKGVAKASEKKITQGTAIHKKLEKEAFPKVIPIRPKTPEDHWGLNLFNMIIRIEKLKSEEAFTRELTVFGFVDGVPLNGIIDELRLELATPDTPTNGNILKISDYKTKSNPHAVSSFSRDRQAQLMLYKVLLDGLLSPNFDWSRFFKLWDLDPTRAFTGPFKSQISSVIVKEGLDASLLEVNTLEGFKDGWMMAVQSLDLVSGRVDSELTVIYRKPRKTSARAKRSNQDESDISDAKSFEYDEIFMKQILKESLEFWRGQRPLQGVSLDDNWKCRSCEYKEDCEWREGQAAVLSHENQV